MASEGCTIAILFWPDDKIAGCHSGNHVGISPYFLVSVRSALVLQTASNDF